MCEYFDLSGNKIAFEDMPSSCLLRGEKVKNRLMHMKYNGKEMYVNVNGTPIFDDEGNVQRAVYCHFDITQHVLQVKKTAEQNKQLEAIVENMSDGLSILDGNGNYILFNKAAKKMFFPSYHYMEKAGDGLYQAEYFDSLGNKIPFEYFPANRVKNGEKFTGIWMKVKFPDKVLHISVSGTPIYDDNNNFIMGILCSRDISKAVEHEENLKQQKDLLEAIVNNMSDALFIFDIDGKYTYMNKSVTTHFTNIISDKIGTGLKEYTYYDENGNKVSFDNLPARRILRGETISEYRMQLKNSCEEIYICINGRPVYDDNGKFLFGIMFMRYITEQVQQEMTIKSQQESVLRAEREKTEVLENAMKMKDEFLATITHEFKTPLTVINAALQTIETIYGNQISDNIKKHLQRIRINSFRQLRLVNNLLDIIRFNSDHLKVNEKNLDIIFVTKAIVKSVDLYAKQKCVTLNFSADTECKEMALDEEKYERILLNLLSNSIKFTPKDKAIYVDVSCKNRKAVITIKDEGIGIPKDKQRLIFKRFGQVDSSLSRQAEGTGIGLSLVKALVSRMKGTIKVKSEFGKGSTFTVTLPIRKLKHIEHEFKLLGSQDSRIMQAVAIEFSDIYLN